MAGVLLLGLVAATVIAAVLATPGSDEDDPIQLGASQNAPATDQQGAGDVSPLVAACDVQPRTLDDVIALLQWEPTGQPPVVPASVVLPASPNVPITLPEGPMPSADDIDGVTSMYGELWGCIFDRNKLGGLALYSDDGVIRNYYTNGIPHIGNIAYLGAPDVEQEWVGRAEVGEPAPRTLHGFRQLPDGRIAAYVTASPPVVNVDGTPAMNSGSGYIVFVNIDGIWLVDESVYVAG